MGISVASTECLFHPLFPGQIGILKCRFLWREERPEYAEKNPQSRDENQQQIDCVLYLKEVKTWEWHVVRHTRKKEIQVLLSGVEPKTFQLLVRMLYHWTTGDLSHVGADLSHEPSLMALAPMSFL